MREGPRIYNLFPLLAGPIRDWEGHLPRIAGMGFNWVYVNPFHYPGFSGSIYAVKDYYRLHPLLEHDGASPDTLLREWTRRAEELGLRVMMDLVINHTSKDAELVEHHPDWFAREADGTLRSPHAIDPADANRVTVWGDLAEIDYAPREARRSLVAYWCELIRHYRNLGFHGFRCDAAYKVPGEIWSELIASARDGGETWFFAEVLGARLPEIGQLHQAGFDYLFNSAKWWDFREDWLLEQYDAFRKIAPSIAFPESHDTPRLAAELARQGIVDPEAVAREYRLRYLFAAFFSAGVLMPMGYEYGFRRALHVVETRPEHWEEPLFDLSGFILEVNRMKAAAPALNEEGPQRRSTSREAPVVGLLRRSCEGHAWAAALINPDAGQSYEIDGDWVLRAVENPPGARAAGPARESDGYAGVEAGPASSPLDALEVTPGIGPHRLDRGARIRLEPLEMRVFRSPTVQEPVVDAARRAASIEAEPGPRRLTRNRTVLIENVAPELDGGRYPVKREVGDLLEVQADIFKEGHDRIAAVLKYRTQDDSHWLEAPMTLVNPGLDRWGGYFRLDRNVRYYYTIEAWMDAWASWRAEVATKREAGLTVTVELLEGRLQLEQALERVDGPDRERLRQVLQELDRLEGDDERGDLLLSSMVQRLMERWPDRRMAAAYERELEVVVDRERARFAAWYTMFPRSQGLEPGRSATFRDCERRLPELRRLGFDVVYLVPIHPIGRTHRKGPNNALEAGPNDPGSPYAIGSELGGHKEIHPELGTLEDFRRFVRAAHDHGMEVALDFAIQCSPDHPYVREHPEWFTFRPDGTIKHAENPPKKYQDIVNVNFYGAHQETLWQELLGILLHWIEQGVRIFRVDNPHTKPFQFWEWCIREVQGRHPEVIFLSEAFTRPKLLQGLAKLGFTQSYTYFTWRNFKQELIDYLTELTATSLREYLRPNLHTNTPDINPFYLQTGGRPAHLVRLTLAATLSPLYGIYSGFELCEATPVPGREEYLNSEKYEYKVWDWDRPGNIKDHIAKINAIRRENPALHELENLRFYPADDDNVLFYGKMTPDRGNMVFVAVNLDPFDAHEAVLELPLEEMGVPAGETFEVEELLTGRRHLWRGAAHRVRLEPAVNPAEIYRITVWQRVDYREPCY